MRLRLSARGDRTDTVVHLTVVETLRHGEIVRRKGEALCRPKASLPNLEPLLRQVLGPRRCCPACIDTLARIRLKHRVELPAATGVLAGELIRLLAKERESLKPKRQRGVMSFPDGS